MPKMRCCSKPEASPIASTALLLWVELWRLVARRQALINPRTPADLNRLLIDQRTQQSPHPLPPRQCAQRLPAAQQIELFEQLPLRLSSLGKIVR